MLRVEFLGSNFPQEQAQQIGYFLDLLRSKMDLRSEDVREVIVVDRNSFGDAVERFDPTRTFTNSEHLIAVGKTFAHRGPDGTGPTSILLWDEIVLQAFAAANSGKGRDERPADSQRAIYAICHEMGHAIDHATRPDFEFDGTFRDAQGRRLLGPSLRDSCAYHFDMLLSELAACAYAGHTYGSQVRAIDVKMNDDAVRGLLSELLQLTRNPFRDLSKLRRDAIALSWFILLQHAKFVGNRLATPDAPAATVEELWECARLSPEIRDALIQADQLLAAMWKTYPDWNLSHLDALMPAFLKISSAFGFRFTDGNGRDGVWYEILKLFPLVISLG